MASLLHEAVVELLRNRPSLSLELLNCAAPLPDRDPDLLADRGRVESVDLGDAKPLERAADFVASFGTGASAIRLITEVQLAPDPDKRLSWPAYVATSWARTGVPTYLLVLALDADVARWAAAPIDLGHLVFRPVVAGPDVVPLLLDAEAALRSPELAVLAVRVHRERSEVAAIAAAALTAVSTLDESRARFYSELVLEWLPVAARAILEATMDIKSEFISDWSREKIAQGRAEGQAQGRAEGQAQGRAEGQAQGRAEGQAQGRAEALLRVLRGRGLTISEANAMRVRACSDVMQLDAWLDRALSVKSCEELFD